MILYQRKSIMVKKKTNKNELSLIILENNEKDRRGGGEAEQYLMDLLRNENSNQMKKSKNIEKYEKNTLKHF